MTTHATDWNGLILAGGRYKITAKLGEGGMGSVYRALDQNIDADVVIKVPRLAMMEDPDFAGRFTREIRSLVKLSHPHIVKVTDVGSYEDTPFAVMQFLPGGTLDDRRPIGPDGQPLPADPQTVGRWLVAVAEALDYVHAQGYVHRDVKPGNILFDAEGHAFLSDFGVAKVIASSPETKSTQTAMTGAGIVLGTPEYMAPELIMGEPFDGRVDQYALAVTVYEVLCGRRPFESDAKTKLLVLHTSKAPPRLNKLCPTLPEGLSQAVLMGLAKNPNERYRTCAALAAAVTAEAQNAVAPGDARVRLKCPACGNAGSVAAADFARLRESGKHVACPSCKSPMETTGPDPGRPSRTPGSGVTNTFNVPGSGGQRVQPREPGAIAGGTAAIRAPSGDARAQTPKPLRGQTMVQHVIDGPGSKPLASDPPLAVGRRPPQNVVERTISDRNDDAEDLPARDPRMSKPKRERGPVATSLAEGAPAKSIRIAAIVGVGVLQVAVVAGVLMWAFGWRREPTPQPPAPLPAAATIAAATPSDSRQTPKPAESIASGRAGAPPQSHGEVASGTSGETKEGLDSNRPERWSKGGASARNEAVDSANPPKTEVVSNERPPADARSERKTANEAKPTAFPEPKRFEFGPLARRPVKVKEKLDKVLASSRSHAAKVIIPAGMYELTRSQNDRRDGPRKYVFTERRFESPSNRPSAKFYLISGATSEMEVESRLAAQLELLNPTQLDKKPAILTVGVTESGDCGLVSLAILQNSYPRLRGGMVPDIVYETLDVTGDSSKPAIGDDRDWENERVFKLAKYSKGLARAYKQMWENMQMSQAQAQMGSIWANVMREAAAQGAAQRALQRSVGGR